MLLKMEEIKLQLRLDDDFSDEDELLELLGKAAQSRTENFLNAITHPGFVPVIPLKVPVQ